MTISTERLDAAMAGDLDLLHAAGRLYGLDPDDDLSA